VCPNFGTRNESNAPEPEIFLKCHCCPQGVTSMARLPLSVAIFLIHKYMVSIVILSCPTTRGCFLQDNLPANVRLLRLEEPIKCHQRLSVLYICVLCDHLRRPWPGTGLKVSRPTRTFAPWETIGRVLMNTLTYYVAVRTWSALMSAGDVPFVPSRPHRPI
jgi:hypothetical protein